MVVFGMLTRLAFNRLALKKTSCVYTALLMKPIALTQVATVYQCVCKHTEWDGVLGVDPPVVRG